ncbi:MAG: hypothetical protein H5U40_01160, partial [Polyangiaceae bacterium]|nr:hypothetical protein [Polyangiaceae bacterium]
EAFRHGKPLGAVGEGVDLLALADLPDVELPDAKSKDDVRESLGVVTLRSPGPAGGVAAKVGNVVGVGPDARLGDFVEAFLSSMAAHRHWSRTRKDEVPA